MGKAIAINLVKSMLVTIAKIKGKTDNDNDRLNLLKWKVDSVLKELEDKQ